MSEEPCCANCRFGRLDSRFEDTVNVMEEAFFECHRRAPWMISARDFDRILDAVHNWHWPIVAPDEWCGEFEPKATDAA